MSTILTDSMARDHANTMQAVASASRRARAARQASRNAHRNARRSERHYLRTSSHPRAAAVSHAAARPFTAVHNWFVAGEL